MEAPARRRKASISTESDKEQENVRIPPEGSARELFDDLSSAFSQSFHGFGQYGSHTHKRSNGTLACFFCNFSFKQRKVSKNRSPLKRDFGESRPQTVVGETIGLPRAIDDRPYGVTEVCSQTVVSLPPGGRLTYSVRRRNKEQSVIFRVA